MLIIDALHCQALMNMALPFLERMVSNDVSLDGFFPSPSFAKMGYR